MRFLPERVIEKDFIVVIFKMSIKCNNTHNINENNIN